MSYSRKVFYGNLCFVCHATVKEKELKKCSDCKLVFYCSTAHQKIHWKHHRVMCKIIKEIDFKLRTEHLDDDDDDDDDSNWYKYRTKLLMLCELGVGRKMEPYEANMILFPNNCQICHKKSDLQPCLDCLCVNYCSEEHKAADFGSHKKICHLFSLCLELDLLWEKSHLYPNYHLRDDDFSYVDSIDSFIEKNIIIENTETMSVAQEMALVSELLTCPLSLLFALNKMQFSFKESFVVHVVGGSFLETKSPKSWEIILRLAPVIQKLVICFIGPEVREVQESNGACSFWENKLRFKFSNEYYHDYLMSESYEKPDVICSFNCGFHEFENSDLDTWNETLPLLIENNKVPLVFTSFTENESKRDSDLLVRIKKNLKVKRFRNQFSSLRPYRDLENLDVYFNNGYIGLVLYDSAGQMCEALSPYMDRKRDSRSRELRREPVQSSSSVADKSSRLRMDAYSDRAGRQKPASPPRRKEIDNVMKKARREGTAQSQYWTKKLLEVEEKDPNRWRHSGYKELYGEKSSSRSKSRSPGGGKRPLPSKPRTGPRSPPLPSSSSASRPRGKSRSRSFSPPRNVSGKPGSSSRPPARGRPHTPPTKPVSKSSGGRPKSPYSGSDSESLSSCSDESCSVCSPKHGRRKNSARSRSRSYSVPRSRPSGPPGKVPPKTSTATIGRKPPTKERPRLEAARAMRDRNSPPRDPRGPPPSPPRSKIRRDSVGDKAAGSKRKLLTSVKVEGQPKKKRVARPGSPADSESDDSSSSSDASGTAAPKLTLSERFGKMAQWSVDRRDIESVKNMRITKDSDSTDFKVVIEGPDEEEVYRAGAPEFEDRRFGAGYFPEAMHAAPIGLTAWDDVRVRYKYYKSRGYLRDLTLDDYMKWEEWWYKYQEWLEAERYYEHWANIRARHHKSRRYGGKLS